MPSPDQQELIDTLRKPAVEHPSGEIGIDGIDVQDWIEAMSKAADELVRLYEIERRYDEALSAAEDRRFD